MESFQRIICSSRAHGVAGHKMPIILVNLENLSNEKAANANAHREMIVVRLTILLHTLSVIHSSQKTWRGNHIIFRTGLS